MARRRAARVARRRERHELKDVGYELFVAAVSVLSIVNLLLMYVVTDQSLDTVLLVMNIILTTILFVDFLYRLATAPSRPGYFFRQFGWADLLSSLPFPQVKIFRVFRLVRVAQLLRASGGRPLDAAEMLGIFERFVEGEFRAGQQAHRHARFVGRGKSARDRIAE